MKARSDVAQATMDRIVEVTVAAIEAGGEPSLRVNDIARDSGVSVATLYHYFGDREGLVVAARLKQYEGATGIYLDDFASAADAATNAAEFAAVVRAFFERATSDASRIMRFTRAEIIGSSRTRPQLADSLRAVQEGLVESLTDVFARAQERGFMSTDFRPRDVVEFSLVLHIGSILPDLLAGDGETSTSLSRVLAEIIDRVFVSQPASAS